MRFCEQNSESERGARNQPQPDYCCHNLIATFNMWPKKCDSSSLFAPSRNAECAKDRKVHGGNLHEPSLSLFLRGDVKASLRSCLMWRAAPGAIFRAVWRSSDILPNLPRS